MNIILIIYIAGVIFNLIIVRKIIEIPSDDAGDGSLAAFITGVILLPLIFLMYVLRFLFIAGSWVSWIVIGIVNIIEHYDK